MPNSNQDLFELIHSLDKNERRYFKLYVKNLGAKSNSYSKLFDAIAKQKVYDEGLLKKQFRKEKFIQNLSATKRYLQEVIMKTLLNYHAESGIDDLILDGIRGFKILLKKGLFLFLLREINRLEKMARIHDRFFFLPVILYWKYLAKAVVNIDHKKTVAAFNEDIEELTESAEYLNLCLIQIVEEQKSRFYWKKHGTIRNETNTVAPKTQKFSENVAYLMRMSDFYYYKNMFKETLEMRLKTVLLYEENEIILKERDNFQSYIVHLVNGMNTCSYGPFIESFYNLQEKFDRLNVDLIPNRSQLQVLDIKLRFYRKIGQIKMTRAIFAEFKVFIGQNSQLSSNQFLPTIYYEMGIALFLDRDYDNALDQLRYSLDLSKSGKIHPNLIYTIGLIELLIFYEKEEWILLPNLIRSYYRKLQKEDEFFVFGKLILKLLKQLINIKNKLEEQEILTNAKREVMDFRDKKSSNMFVFFPYEEWIKSKLEKRNLLLMIKEKY